jgi:hypothetical protein
MKKIFFNISLIITSSLALIFSSISQVAAQTASPICEVFPFLKGIQLFGGMCTINEDRVGLGLSEVVRGVLAILRFAASMIFVVIVAIAVFVIIKSSIKIILSNGDSQKVKDAQDGIKSVFWGITWLILGIVGLVILLTFFQSTGALQIQNEGRNFDIWQLLQSAFTGN